jgi:hypothetical protein
MVRACARCGSVCRVSSWSASGSGHAGCGSWSSRPGGGRCAGVAPAHTVTGCVRSSSLTCRRSPGRRGWCGASSGGDAGGCGRCWTAQQSEVASARCAMTTRLPDVRRVQAGRHGSAVAEVAKDLECDRHKVMDAVRVYGRPLVDDPRRCGTVTAPGLDETCSASTARSVAKRGRPRSSTSAAVSSSTTSPAATPSSSSASKSASPRLRTTSTPVSLLPSSRTPAPAQSAAGPCSARGSRQPSPLPSEPVAPSGRERPSSCPTSNVSAHDVKQSRTTVSGPPAR